MGETYSKIVLGLCPPSLQQPSGKKIQASIIGTYPYMIYDKETKALSGAGFEILDIYARKFNFTYTVIKVPTYDAPGGKIDTASIFNQNLLCTCTY